MGMVKTNRNKYTISAVLVLLNVFIFVGCSTEQNSFVNRTYHQTTAKYNGYFNAREIINADMKLYWRSFNDNFEFILPLEQYPDDMAVLGMKENLEKAIDKLSVVIYKHSMPNARFTSNKDEEHNKWIDENWLQMGIAYYIMRDYASAETKFKFIYRNYPKETTLYD